MYVLFRMIDLAMQVLSFVVHLVVVVCFLEMARDMDEKCAKSCRGVGRCVGS